MVTLILIYQIGGCISMGELQLARFIFIVGAIFIITTIITIVKGHRYWKNKDSET